MAEFTFLELHFENSDLTANAPYSQRSGDGESVTDDDSFDEEGGSNRGALIAALVGLSFLAIVAYAVRNRLFRDGENNDSAVEV